MQRGQIDIIGQAAHLYQDPRQVTATERVHLADRGEPLYHVLGEADQADGVGGKVAGIAPEKVFKATLPFFLPLLAGLAVISYVPWVTEWLPSLVFSR